MRVLWTEQAFERLAEIEEYIAADDPGVGRRWTERLIERAEALADFPGMGRTVPELPGGSLRELIVGNYRVVYRARPDAIEVLTVFEAHRLLPEEDLPAADLPPSAHC
ncbi:MAG: type II toxin-antitoxin system RelE/ParE family toxin [Planctomycetota bacterium]